MIYQHYTTILHLPFILAAGVLKPSRRDAHGDHRFGLLWFSSNGRMEPTARKSDAMMIRFGSDAPEIQPWRRVAKQAGYSAAVMRRLEGSGRKVNAVPGQWGASAKPLPIEAMRLEALQGHAWRAVDPRSLTVRPVVDNVLSLSGPGGLIAVVGRKRTPEGYFAYGTNMALYRPEHLFGQASGMERAG